MELITKDNAGVIKLLQDLKGVSQLFEILKLNYRPPFKGEYYLTDKEVSERLKISRRTLQDYRTEGKIAYILIGGKILYKESDIEKMLEKGYCKARS